MRPEAFLFKMELTLAQIACWKSTAFLNRTRGSTRLRRWAGVSLSGSSTPIKSQTKGVPTAPRQSAETLFSFYPGLEKKISVDDWLAERNVLHEEAFKRVRPLRGAVSLVKRLHETGVPIAIATGSNTNNFKWKTVSRVRVGVVHSLKPDCFLHRCAQPARC